jgi:hypothetical protein
MGMEPAYPAVLATHLCDDRRIRPVQIGRAGREVRENFSFFHCRYRSWDRLPQRGALNQLSSVGTSRQGRADFFIFALRVWIL